MIEPAKPKNTHRLRQILDAPGRLELHRHQQVQKPGMPNEIVQPFQQRYERPMTMKADDDPAQLRLERPHRSPKLIIATRINRRRREMDMRELDGGKLRYRVLARLERDEW